MKSVVFRPEAEADIEAIWDYTIEIWGRDQANFYIREIRAVIEAVADGRRPSVVAQGVRTGYRKVQIARHVAFLRESAEVVEVVRVLHERMDVGRV